MKVRRGYVNINEYTISSVNLRTSLGETLEQMSEEGCVVDILLKQEPFSEEIQKDNQDATQSVRIILVGADYIALGPKKPLIDCIVPLSSILFVRMSGEGVLPNEDEIDKEIEEKCVGWERDWPETFRKQTRLPDDGLVHEVDHRSFDQSMPEGQTIVVLYSKNSKECSKVLEKLQVLADEFRGEARFVVTQDSELADSLWMNKAPTVSFLHGDEIMGHIRGVASIRDYRRELRNALEEVEED